MHPFLPLKVSPALLTLMRSLRVVLLRPVHQSSIVLIHLWRTLLVVLIFDSGTKVRLTNPHLICPLVVQSAIAPPAASIIHNASSRLTCHH